MAPPALGVSHDAGHLRGGGGGRRARRPSLVFMDVHLPGAVDGWQAAAHMWAQRRMPIISLTGQAAPHLLSAVQTPAPVVALSKPFTKTALRETLRRASAAWSDAPRP